MRRHVRSKTYYRRVKAVFTESWPELSAILARMSVLYEDLRIEYEGARTAEKIELFDVLDPIYRKFYFLRRSTITLVEFIGAFQYLEQRPEFKPVREKFDETARKRWTKASEFFGQNKEFLKGLRNDCGGHFQLSTTRKVLDGMHVDTVGKIELVFDNIAEVGGPRLHYAYSFVAAALTKERPDDADVAAWARQTFEIISDGWLHAVWTMHTLVVYQVVPAFKY